LTYACLFNSLNVAVRTASKGLCREPRRRDVFPDAISGAKAISMAGSDGANEATMAIGFGPYRLLRAQRLLVRDGMPVLLGSRAFDILLTLIDRRPEVVSKDELIRAVWGRQNVEDNTLAVHLSALRRALSEGRRGGIRYIGTVHGRGYHFLGPVAEPGESRIPRQLAEPGNLPRPAAPLLGREAVLDQLAKQLDTVPLVTLVGPGGIGKTRLAQELANRIARSYPGGAWWIDLTTIAEDSLVAGTAARTLELSLADAPPLPQLVRKLEGPPRLLVLDNCEHVIAGAAELAAALCQVAGLRLLATSLEPLAVAGEKVERLESLSVPEPTATVEQAMATHAVMLFVARAQATNRDFRLDGANVEAVARACRWLDGVPLALEFAATNAALLGARALVQRLDTQFLRLGSKRRDVPAKHHTLQALIEWSYGLLTAEEQLVLRRLAIFAGGCTLAAAEATVADATVPNWRVAEHLTRLIGKSLVIVEQTEQEARYRLLETTRIFSRDKLENADEAEATATRHVRYYAMLFDQAYAAYEMTADQIWLRRYGPELDNVRSALDHALAAPDCAKLAVALSGAAAPLFDRLALRESRRFLDRAVECVGPDTPPADAARLLFRAGLQRVNFDHQAALPLLKRALNLYEQLGDRPSVASVQASIASLFSATGRSTQAREMLLSARNALSSSDRSRSLMRATVGLGNIAYATGAYSEAQYWYGLARDQARKLNNELEEALSLTNLAETSFALGEIHSAIELSRQAVPIYRRHTRRDLLAASLMNLTAFLIVQGDHGEARNVAVEVFDLLRNATGLQLRYALEQWALLGAIERHGALAAAIFSFTEASSRASVTARGATEREIRDRLQSALQAQLSVAELQAAAPDGAHLTEEQARMASEEILFGI
jgi:predicted ATPase/DNA-binding winged helix-turn-helix (wHTH) protein